MGGTTPFIFYPPSKAPTIIPILEYKLWQVDQFSAGVVGAGSGVVQVGQTTC